MLSSTQAVLRILKYHSALNLKNIVLKPFSLKHYCQQTSNINNQLETVQNKNKSALETLDNAFETIDVNTLTLTPEEEAKIKTYEQTQESSVLEPSDQDVSHVKPFTPATQTFARYANQSTTIQKLADLGVHLYRWENSARAMNILLKLDYETGLKKYISFFVETIGIPVEELGPMLSLCPFVLGEKIENMKARIEYLKMKKFTDHAIARIIVRHPRWLEYKVEQIDERLGFFQQSFHLSGNEVRALCEQLPKLITKKKEWILEVSFAVKEQMGFNNKEMKKLLLTHPRLWTQDAGIMVSNFNYVHSEMLIPHSAIVEYPNILTSRLFRVQNRHLFLVKLSRNQYDPTKEHYVSLESLISGSDAEFCTNVARTTIELYNMFLKTAGSNVPTTMLSNVEYVPGKAAAWAKDFSG
uniref:Transcription termination factor 3, mitochondrial n=1 Tax=Cacopsylla melanoneura TaxID=428564 RepID=A0A8D9F1D1_9HEMI